MSPTVLLWLITGCLMLQPLSTDLYLASLPHLVTYFAVTPAAVQQTLSLFVIGFGTAQLVGGPLSDRYGRRPVLLGGLAIYTLSSIACGLAPSLALLVAARFAQAVGCCTAVVVARAIIRDAYAPAEGAHMIARASMLLSFAPLLGPIAGGYLQVAFGWRAAFALLTLLCLALTVASLRWLKETNAAPDMAAMRVGGMLESYGRIARAPVFWAYTLPGALSYASIFVFISGSSFVLIEVLGMPTQYYGYCYAFGVSGYLAGTIACRKLLGRIGVDKTLSIGTTLSLLAGLLFAALVAAGVRHWAVVPLCQFLTMGAHGINFPCAQSGAVAPFPQQAGAAAGLLGFVTMLSHYWRGSGSAPATTARCSRWPGSPPASASACSPQRGCRRTGGNSPQRNEICCRRASNRQIAAAAATLSDSLPEAIGMVVRALATAASAGETPAPSLPKIQATGPLSSSA